MFPASLQVWHISCLGHAFVPTQSRFVRAFLKRGALFSVFLLMLLVAVGVAFQGGGNPTIQPGGTASFPRTGYDSPAYAMTWDIKNGSGTIIAQDDTPNGWSMNVVNDNLVVTAPSNAAVGTNYEVRFSGAMQEMGGLRSRQARAATMKARIQVPRTFGGAPAKPGEKTVPFSTKKTKVNPDDIIIYPVSKSAYFDVVAANNAPAAPTNLTANAVASNRINMSWTDNSSNESGFKVYCLAPGGSWTAIATLASNVTSFSDIPLQTETSYSYKVTAVNAYGESDPSNTGTQTTFASGTVPDGYAGKAFYIIVPDNCATAYTNHSGAKVRVTAEDGATGTLTLTATGDTTSFTVPAGGSTLLSLSDFHRLHQNDEVNNESYSIATDKAVTVEVFDYDEYVSESWAVLPNQILGTEYVSSNYIGSGGYMSQIALVATTDNTVVTIKPQVTCGANRAPNVPFTVTLNHGQAYQLKSAQWDLTGTQISSTQPIGVVSGAQGARVPLEYGYGNPLEEQLLPFNRWQSEYVGIPFSHHPHARFRLTSARNRTHVSVYFGDTDTTTTYTLDAGQVQEVETTSPIYVTADKPIQGMQLSNGEALDYNFNDPATVGDPMMVTMPSTYSPNTLRSNWLSNVIIPVAADGFDYHYVTLIATDASFSTMYLNGNVISGWQHIGSTSFQYVRLALPAGNNVINGTKAFFGNASARFLAYTNLFAESDAAGSIIGGLTLANDYVNVHPNDPTNLTATPVSASAIDLAWIGDSNAYGYRVERKTETGQWGQIANVTSGTTTSFHDTGLHHKTKYYYRVIAYADEDSGYSNTANATTLNEKPTVPTSFSAVAQSDSQIQLTWTDTSDNEDHFYIQRSPNGQGDWSDVQTTDPNVTSWTDTNLTKKTTYYYRIKSANEMGDLGWTAPASATTKDTRPNAPASLVATAVAYNAIDLTWTDASDNEDGFRIERLNSAGAWVTVGYKLPNQTSFHDASGLAPLTTYTYRVIAYNNGGDSDPSNQASATTLTPPPPAAPSNLIATAVYEDEIHLTWSDNSLLETGFHLERMVAGGSWIPVQDLPANTTSFSDDTVSPSHTYTYRVRAFNQGGNSNWSNEASATTPAGSTSGAPYLKSIQIDADSMVGSGQTTATAFLSARISTALTIALSSSSTSVSTPASVVVPAGQRQISFPVTITNPGKSFYAFVYGTCGDWMQKAKVSSFLTDSELIPSQLTASSGRGGIWLRWSGVDSSYFGNSVAGYAVERKVDGGSYAFLTTVPIDGTTFVDATVLSAETCTYRVSLVDSSGHALHSSTTTLAPSATPSGISFAGLPSVLSGTVHLVLSGQSLGSSFDAYVDGKVFGSGGSGSMNSENSSNIQIELDTTALSNGTHTLQVSANDSIGGRETSPMLTITVNNDYSEFSNDGLAQTDDSLFPQFDVAGPADSISWDVQIKDDNGSVVRSWHGSGSRAHVTWDGNLGSGVNALNGTYNPEVRFVNPSGTHDWRRIFPSVVRIDAKPKFLALTMTREDSDFAIAYGKSMRLAITQCAMQRKAMDPSLTYLVYEYQEHKRVPKQFVDAVRKWLGDSVEYFYMYGHGCPSKADHIQGGLFGVTWITNSQYWDDGGKGISVPKVVGTREYRWVWMDVCFSAGCDEPNGPVACMSEFPNTQWVHAFNIPYWRGGQFSGNNGYGKVSDFQGHEYCWGRYRKAFWYELGLTGDIPGSHVYATIHAGAQDMDIAPWNYYEFASGWQMKLFHTGSGSLP